MALGRLTRAVPRAGSAPATPLLRGGPSVHPRGSRAWTLPSHPLPQFQVPAVKCPSLGRTPVSVSPGCPASQAESAEHAVPCCALALPFLTCLQTCLRPRQTGRPGERGLGLGGPLSPTEACGGPCPPCLGGWLTEPATAPAVTGPSKLASPLPLGHAWLCSALPHSSGPSKETIPPKCLL